MAGQSPGTALYLSLVGPRKFERAMGKLDGQRPTAVKPMSHTVRDETPDIDALGNVGTTLNGHGAIGMDTRDSERIGTGTKCQFVRIGGADEHAISNFVVMKDARAICESSSFVNDDLAFLTNQFHVRKDGNVEQHVTVERKTAGRMFEAAVDGSACRVCSGLQSSVDHKSGLFNVLRRLVVNDSA